MSKYISVLAVFLILITIFIESFTFHQLKSSLPSFIRDHAIITFLNPSTVSHIFVTLAYITPIFAALLSDSYLGKFPIIVILGMVYIVGQSLLTLSALLPSTKDGSGIATYIPAISGLIITALGTAYKPCIAAMGADQVSPDNWTLYFQLYYITINIASFFSILFLLFFKALNINGLFWATFLVPTIFTTFALFIFLVGFQSYNHIRPKRRNIVIWLLGIFIAALINYSQYTKESKEFSESTFEVYTSNVPPSRQGLLDNSSEDNNEQTPNNENKQPNLKKQEMLYNKDEVNENTLENQESNVIESKDDSSTLFVVEKQSTINTKKLPLKIKSHFFDAATLSGYSKEDTAIAHNSMSLLFQLSPLVIFWSVFEQYSSAWDFQATYMVHKIGNYEITPQTMHLINPFIVVLFIPIIGVLCRLFRLKPLQKISIGFLFAIVGYILSVVVEILVISNPFEIHIFFQIPQILFMTISEVLIVVTGLEFAYSESSTHLKASVSSLMFLNVAIGSIIIVFSQFLQDQLFKNLRYGSVFVMLFFLSLLLLGFLVFALLSLSYEYKSGTKLTQAKNFVQPVLDSEDEEATAREADEFSFKEENSNEKSEYK